MPARQPYFGQRKLVLGFDIGTTYSGISYCILQPGEIPEIRGVTKQSYTFPGQAEGRGNAKVPSVLYYDANGKVKAIGNEALTVNAMNDAEEYGWTKAEWWKLHLRPQHLASAHIKDEDIPPLPPKKTAVDVLTDFVRYLYECVRIYIQEHHMGFNWNAIRNAIEFVFSHPNGWEGLQQQKYREAIEGASLIPSTPEGRSRVHMVTEGEASMHYCISSLSEQRGNSGPQGVVVIDAGGGTIDLSAYSVAFTKPITCSEVAPAECRLQGAVFVTRRAKTLLLSRKLKGSSHCKADEIEDLTRKFDESTKLTIRSPDEAVYLTIGNLRYNNARFGIKRGTLSLSGKEATSLFDESIQAIINAFEQQRKAAKVEITMAFVVGGLGGNDFVWSRLQTYFMAQGITVCRPDNDVNKAVANGAVIFHIDHAVKSRVARATFGIFTFPFADETDSEHCSRKDKWEMRPSGKYVIPGGFRSIVLKGDEIDEKEEIRRSFFYMRTHQAEFGNDVVDIVRYSGEQPNPRWVDEDPSSYTTIGKIRADLTKVAKSSDAQRIGPTGEVYYKVDIEVVVFFGFTELKAQMVWKDNGVEERTPLTIVYLDESRRKIVHIGASSS